MKSTSKRKSFSKRIKITKNGKVIRRSMRIDHFKTRGSTPKSTRQARKDRGLDYPLRNV